MQYRIIWTSSPFVLYSQVEMCIVINDAISCILLPLVNLPGALPKQKWQLDTLVGGNSFLVVQSVKGDILVIFPRPFLPLCGASGSPMNILPTTVCN